MRPGRSLLCTQDVCGVFGGLPGGLAAHAERLQVQILDLGRHRLGDDLLPVDIRAAQRVAHGADQHHVHTLGVAQLDGDIAGGYGDGLEIPGHGLDAAGGIGLGTGGDGGGLDGVVIDDGPAVGVQELRVADGFHLLQRHHDVGLTLAEHGAIDLLAPADLRGHAAAALGHAVYLALLDVIAGLHKAVGHDLGDQDGALTAHTYQQAAFHIVHVTSPPFRWRQTGRPGRRRCSPRTGCGR